MWMTIKEKQKNLSSVFTYLLPVIAFTAAIITLTVSTNSGGINYDGSYYLRLAKSFMQGEGFWVGPPHSDNIDQATFFSDRPIGYSFFIAFVATVFYLPVYWGAKALTVLVFTGVLTLFWHIYGNKSLFLIPCFLFAHCLEVYFHVLTEPLFIGWLILFVFLVTKVFSKGFKWNYLLLLALVGCLMVLTRYVGVFFIPIIGFFTLYNPYTNKWQFSPLLLFPLFTSLLFAGIYFLINAELSGFITGYPKANQSMPFYEVITVYLWELLHQLNFLVGIIYRGEMTRVWVTILSVIFEILIIWRLVKYYQPTFPLSRISPIAKIAFTTAFLYLFLIWGIYFFKFYQFSFRFLVPFTVLVIWGLFDQIYNFGEKRDLQFLRYTILAFATISFIVNVGLRSFYHLAFNENKPYLKHIEAVKKKYKTLPSGSIVLFPRLDLNYLRLDLKPLYKPSHMKPDDFAEKIPDTTRVYLNCCELQDVQFSDRKIEAKWNSVCEKSKCVKQIRHKSPKNW